MKKTKSIPAIIMLVAGLIDCIFSIYYHLSLWEFTRQLLLVLIIFYLMGCIVQIVVDINFKPMEEEGQEGSKEDEAQEGTEVTDEGSEEDNPEPLPENLEDIQSET